VLSTAPVTAEEYSADGAGEDQGYQKVGNGWRLGKYKDKERKVFKVVAAVCEIL